MNKLGKLMIGGVLCSILVASVSIHSFSENTKTAQSTTEIKVETNAKKQTPDDAKEEKKAQFDSIDDYLYTTDTVNVRVEPSMEAEIYKVYAEYTKVHVIGVGQEWSQIEIDDKTYYIYNDYLDKVDMVNMGTFDLTAYCGCQICSDNYEDRIARPGVCNLGKHSRAIIGHTIAVDPSVIPYGSKVYIEGYGVYYAEDCGGAVKGNIIDIFWGDNHSATDDFGRRHANVYIIKD